MDYILECDDLVKKYGNKVVLNNLNLKIPKGKIVGLLGPNGAGKTTLIKVIASLLNYNSGQITIDGKSPGVDTKKIVAYLPDREFLYQWMSIAEAINFFKKSFEDFDDVKAYSMISTLNLDSKQKIKSLSKGMQEKLNISLTFSRKSKLFVLDEPLAAVDVVTRDKIIEIILKNFDKNSSILISTHLINDIEYLFNEVVFINDGKIILHGDVLNLKNKYKKSIQDLFKEII
ncbi:ABC transporter ATP-binding protein [Clostridium tetani]|uniref:ABC transporter ATP-binding protein n=1 Tax=Clostridium tetani TaxID=1513 RepID=A0ABC8EDI5_CLOTA|nr:ABC transporter ATP-binding protein [Clostridium tetani]BDR67769.1 ABC transporter ATP-binding protein [Clostridium tetani]BDR70400.1 ABC transporter ATP-binding protein [Clostridium tetani]BDR73193.1 ABC transporter ATP-binding protein [Clostridium tetani]BDR81704.1 ABC transporter ATP-binding protein [Clostridium tetani]BDR90086.1 ABC transporter ATP-binding protein [Clostridium tetani]